MLSCKRIFLLATLVMMTACSETDKAPSTAIALASSTGTGPLVQDRFRVSESAMDHSGTFAGLLTALDRRDLTVFAIIDHAASAKNAGLDLPPSTLVIFGNPRAGTPLIQSEPLLGAELPLRALIYDRGEKTYLAMTGMGFLERTYNLQSQMAIIDKVSETLDAIASEATTLAIK